MQMENPSPSQAERPASTTSLMDPSLYKAAMEGMRDVLLQNKDQLDVLVSPNKNTVLHIAAQFGKLQCVKQILDMCPVIYDRLNSKGETPLHLAARGPHYEIVKALIEHAKDEERGHGVGAAKEMLMLVNKDKDTALHEAVRSRLAPLVELLAKEAPELSHMANNADETPLYLAAERRYKLSVSHILANCTSPAYGGPYGRTALHASAFHNLKECTEVLLNWNQDLVKKADIYGWLPLHYAARMNNVPSVRQLLDKDKSVAYLKADEDNEMTALHVAATQGHVDVIEVLISECPGCWEIVNSRGQNILHIAVKHKKKKLIKFILKNSSLESLINQKDDDGNTPLHLLVASNFFLSELIMHPIADKSTYNKKNLTPRDIAFYSNDYTMSQGLIKSYLEGATLGWRTIISRDKDEIAATEKSEMEAKEKLRACEREMVVPQDIRKTADTHLIVAALVATVTFAAGFTVPGGFDGNEGPNQGFAILTRKAAFQAFVITDAIAMILSICAILIFFTVANIEDKRQLVLHYSTALKLISIAMVAAVIAFITGMYAVLSHSPWLAITECVICVLFFTFSIFKIFYQAIKSVNVDSNLKMVNM
uniref:PGG domain-containing protein n=1 Tax=Davidia involucrata TaxID=16924 RepID=A0A5B7AUZ0_DAVIN